MTTLPALPQTTIVAQPRIVCLDKQVIFDPESRDFAMYLDGELVGFARTYQEAEVTLDELVYELLRGGSFQTAA